MTSTALLSPSLTNLLLPFTQRFELTADNFQRRIEHDPEGYFRRVCELLNTLEFLASSQDPVRNLREVREGVAVSGGSVNGGGSIINGGNGNGNGIKTVAPNGRDNPANANGNGFSPKPEASNKDAETLLAIMLNSEYVLYKLYSAHPIDMNPALSHWVGDCKEFDKYEREYRESNKEWGIRERVLKIRQAFVKGILLGEGKGVSFNSYPYSLALLCFAMLC
jgi:hypothetical protein